MAGDSFIRLRGIALRFLLYHNRSLALRELILHSLAFKGLTRTSSLEALKGVDLDVRSGERVALIGVNGAGKSSLLKVISKIYPPSAGELEVQGRLSALIEAGACFHPELTGRENIVLTGTIYGFPRREIATRLDRIMEFSGVDPKFLDTPIKYYSTGMQVRVAFAIAAELDPEILILDEIFVGGDLGFIEKAARRLDELAGRAHILVLVTHDMQLARRMTTRTIWLDAGAIRQDGPTEEVVRAYEQSFAS